MAGQLTGGHTAPPNLVSCTVHLLRGGETGSTKEARPSIWKLKQPKLKGEIGSQAEGQQGRFSQTFLIFSKPRLLAWLFCRELVFRNSQAAFVLASYTPSSSRTTRHNIPAAPRNRTGHGSAVGGKGSAPKPVPGNTELQRKHLDFA